MDFSGIQFEALQMLQSNSDVLAGLKSKFSHLMVDEYQDTNTIQEQLLFLLAGDKKNLCVVGDDDQAIDALAFGRPAEEYRSCHLVEFFTEDWATAFARHWLFDLADQLRWELVAESSIVAVRHLAARVEREELFHRMHAQQMLEVLINDEVARARLVEGVTRLVPLVGGLFEPVAGEQDAIAQSVAAGAFGDRWPDFVAAVEAQVGPIVWGTAPEQNGRTTRSADWQPLMTRMREVIDLDPAAIW